MKTVVAVIVAFLMLLASCQHKSQNTSLDKSTDKSDIESLRNIKKRMLYRSPDNETYDHRGS